MYVLDLSEKNIPPQNPSTLHSAPQAPHLASSIPFSIARLCLSISTLHLSVALRFHYSSIVVGSTAPWPSCQKCCVSTHRRASLRVVAVSNDQLTTVVQQEVDGCCVVDRWKGESEGVEFEKRSTRILDGHIRQALAEHVFACARWSKTVVVRAMGAIVAMDHVGCKMRRLGQ